MQRPRPVPVVSESVRPDEADRYAIIVLEQGGRSRRRVAETSRDGIGVTLTTLRDEGELDGNDSIGVLDRFNRTWLINPYGKARP